MQGEGSLTEQTSISGFDQLSPFGFTASPPPHHADCAQVQGPELKPGLNLPYLGVTQWHSPSGYVFLSSPGLTHTLPSNHKLHTSPTPAPTLPPPTISPTGSFRKHSPSPMSLLCLSLSLSPTFFYTHILYIHRFRALGAGMYRGSRCDGG